MTYLVSQVDITSYLDTCCVELCCWTRVITAEYRAKQHSDASLATHTSRDATRRVLSQFPQRSRHEDVSKGDMYLGVIYSRIETAQWPYCM